MIVQIYYTNQVTKTVQNETGIQKHQPNSTILVHVNKIFNSKSQLKDARMCIKTQIKKLSQIGDVKTRSCGSKIGNLLGCLLPRREEESEELMKSKVVAKLESLKMCQTKSKQSRWFSNVPSLCLLLLLLFLLALKPNID